MADYDGKEWERKVKGWLRIRYPRGGFIDVPDQHGGDFGIEGFSTDGIVYQCYAPRESLRAKELFENHKKKLNESIQKFIDNKTDLQNLFGSTKIHQYWLVTPENKSSQLIQLAQTKADEVRRASLPYVADDFRVHIAPQEDFSVERSLLLAQRLEQLKIDPIDPDPGDITNWTLNNEPLVQRLDGKIGRLLNSGALSNIEIYREQVLRFYLQGSNQKERLRNESQSLFESVDQCRRNRERFLTIENLSSPDPPKKYLNEQRQRLIKDLQEKAPGLHPETVNELAFGIESAWLIQCNLDFPTEDSASARRNP